MLALSGMGARIWGIVRRGDQRRRVQLAQAIWHFSHLYDFGERYGVIAFATFGARVFMSLDQDKFERSQHNSILL